MAWIQVIPPGEASGDLAAHYSRMCEPDGSVDNILTVHSLKVQDHYRALLRQPASLEEWDGTPALISMPQFDDILDAERLSVKVALTLAALSEQYRAALLWRYWENCSVRDMAQRTNKTEKAIERLLARARKAFKDGWDHV
jgi:RNA polymerase sigma factor (sigma-70 family)